MHTCIKDRTMYKREKERSKLRMGGGSWSINMQESEIFNVDEIVYETEKRTYRIDRNTALEKGFQRILGGERKLVVPIKYWT